MKVNKLVLAIKDYILNDENKEETVSQLKRYKEEFPSEPDYNYYRYGNSTLLLTDKRVYYKSRA